MSGQIRLTSIHEAPTVCRVPAAGGWGAKPGPVAAPPAPGRRAGQLGEARGAAGTWARQRLKARILKGFLFAQPRKREWILSGNFPPPGLSKNSCWAERWHQGTHERVASLAEPLAAGHWVLGDRAAPSGTASGGCWGTERLPTVGELCRSSEGSWQVLGTGRTPQPSCRGGGGGRG